MELTRFDNGVSLSIVETVGADTLGIDSCPREKRKRLTNSVPPNTRRLRNHTSTTSQISEGAMLVGISSCPGEKHKGMKNSQPLNSRRLRSHSGSQISHQSGIKENVPTRDIPTLVTGESSGCSNLKARPPATLEFHVRSEEGINLFVDLNSNSSDWTKKLKMEVCILPEMLNANPRVLHHKLGICRESEEQMKASFLGNTAVKSNTTSDLTLIESLPSSVGRDIPEESIRSSVTIPKNIAESSLVREGDPKVLSLCDNYSQNSLDLSSESHLQNGNETFVSASSKLSDISESGSKSDSKCPTSAETVPMSTLVSSKPDLPIVKFSEDRTTLITSFPENSGGVIPMCSTGDSMGMQSSQVASYSDDTEKCSLQADKGRSGNKELGQNTNGGPPCASSEEGGGSNPISEKDSSECSQINKLSKRSFKCSDNPEPGGLQINRRITRSQDRQSIATPRRSSRLLVSQ